MISYGSGVALYRKDLNVCVLFGLLFYPVTSADNKQSPSEVTAEDTQFLSVQVQCFVLSLWFSALYLYSDPKIISQAQYLDRATAEGCKLQITTKEVVIEVDSKALQDV